MADRQKVLIVDDDGNIAELISLYLTKECFDTQIAEDGEEALVKFKEFGPDIILLDLMLPGIDGYEVCRELRKTSQVPIIMLSAKGEVFDKVLGLELGADDYMVKPFDSKELVARVKAVLRRKGAAAEPAEKQEPLPENSDTFVAHADLIVDLANYTVTYCGEYVDMPPKELELLFYLAKHPNRVFSREQLLDRVWGYEYMGDTRTVDVHIKRLREKIKDRANWSLSTVWGVGYKFELRK
jgi:DNA-binding response OmpR family regulator